MKHALYTLPVLLSLAMGSAHAQTANTPGGGANLSERIADTARERTDQAERDAAQKIDGPTVISDPVNRAELPPAGGATVVLKSVTFDGSSVFISDAELEAIASKYRGRRVDFREIASLVRDINDLYAEKEIITAAAILPPQDLSKGDLTVKLVEGQVGNVAVLGDNRTRSDYIINRIRLAHGTTVDTPTASKDINFFNKTSKAQVRMLLRPGAQFGFTDILFGVVEPAPHQLNVIIDNEGVSSTGELQGSAIYQSYGLLGVDDSLLLYGAMSEGTRATSAKYDVPVSRYGTRLSVSGTWSAIKVVEGAAQVLDITGNSRSASANLTQPFLVNSDWVVSAIGGVFVGENVSKAGAVKLVDAYTEKYSGGISATFIGDAASLSFQGQVVEASVKDRLANANEQYTLVTGSAYAAYRFSDQRTVASIYAAGQSTNEDLVPGNLLFSIGGPTTVRGYPSDGVAGDSGYYLNLELAHRLPSEKFVASLFSFFDYGEVFSTFPENTILASAGAGIDWQINERATLRLTGAFPLRDVFQNQSDFTAYASLNLRVF